MQTTDEAETVRSMIKAENEFANHRLGWMNTINGLLFAGVAFAWGKVNASLIIGLFCVFGIFVCLTTFGGVVAAVRAMLRQFDWWERNKPTAYSGPEVIGIPPPVNGFLRYLLAPQLHPPLIFMMAWVAILVVAAKHAQP